MPTQKRIYVCTIAMSAAASNHMVYAALNLHRVMKCIHQHFFPSSSFLSCIYDSMNFNALAVGMRVVNNNDFK